MFRRLPWTIAVCTAAWCWHANGMAAATVPQADQEPTAVEAKDELTVERLQQLIDETESNAVLDEANRTRVVETLTQAIGEIKRRDERVLEAALYKSRLESAPADLKQAEQEKVAPPAGFDFSRVGSQDLNALGQQLSALEEDLAQATRAFSEAQAEPQRRVNRKAAFAELASQFQIELEEVERSLSAGPVEGESPALQQARRTLLEARREALKAELAAIENERRAYEAQGELPRLRIDIATARVNQLQADVQRLQRIIAERRQRDAAEQLQKATAVFQSAPEPLKSLAQRSLNLVYMRMALASGQTSIAGIPDDVSDIIDLCRQVSELSDERPAAARQLKRWTDDLARMQKRAESVHTATLGRLLVEKMNQLPGLEGIRSDIDRVENLHREFQGELIQLEEQRADLSDMERAVAAESDRLRNEGIVLPAGADETMLEILRNESQILDTLLNDANRQYESLLALAADHVSLYSTVNKYAQFINEHVLWVRSTDPIEPADVYLAGEALLWLGNAESWRAAGIHVIDRPGDHPVKAGLLAIAVLLSLYYRRRTWRYLQQTGAVAERALCRTMKETLQGFGYTVLLALTWPLLIWSLGWVLSGSDNSLLNAVAISFRKIAIAVFFVEFIRLACAEGGLGDCHLDWSDHAIGKVRRNLGTLEFVGLPLAFFAVLFENQPNTQYRETLGRFFLIAALVVFTYVLWRLLRPRDGVFARPGNDQEPSPGAFVLAVFLVLLLILPAVLIAITLEGYQYTAYRVGGELLLSFCAAGCLIILLSMIFRWILVKRRQIRWQQLMDARSRGQQNEPGESSELEALAVKAEMVNVTTMDQQARRAIVILFVVLTVAGFSALWSDYLPALTPVFLTELWSVDAAGGTVIPVTVGKLLLAIFVLVVALLASRDIPGLIDAMLLGRIGVDSASRYVISTLTRYFLVIVGLLVSCYMIGISWQSAQWLVAALGVGIGFGLQEIVSNFICGILLLFERPIRVGDIVTLGETTGMVTRIRSRATTVRNWDRQEVVIPNRELITGRIVNWTLEDSINRLTFVVGIAYGSDTEKARSIIVDVLANNPNVMNDPAPMVSFDQFGESTLNFTIRAFLTRIDDRLETRHQLHSEIHRAFKQAGIELAFPQRDLHIRSIDPAVLARQPLFPGPEESGG